MPAEWQNLPGRNSVNLSRRAQHEIVHGRLLAQGDPEVIWGWGTPAGRLRAQRRAALIAQGAELKPGVRALEIGCGTGLFTEMFAQTGAQLIAVDISKDLLARARLRNLPPDRVIFLEKRFEDCQVDGPFDAIIGSSILHHLDIQITLPKIYELLKPGGIICFAEPNMMNPQVYIERQFAHWKKWFWYVSEDETAFFRWQLAGLLSQAGFCEVEITPFDWLHPATPARFIRHIKTLGHLLECTPLIREFSGSLLIRGRRRLANQGAGS
jgi:2-polyprenyl-3-methyl-5-hydroxy-6-metoxy-1,4-benzoquinol methylase